MDPVLPGTEWSKTFSKWPLRRGEAFASSRPEAFASSLLRRWPDSISSLPLPFWLEIWTILTALRPETLDFERSAAVSSALPHSGHLWSHLLHLQLGAGRALLLLLYSGVDLLIFSLFLFLPFLLTKQFHSRYRHQCCLQAIRCRASK